MSDTAIQLKVAEANHRDTGRGGISRVDPQVWAKLGIDDSGEAVSLKGKRETVVKIMPAIIGLIKANVLLAHAHF